MPTSLTDNGYLVFPKVVPEDFCQRVIADILSHTRDGKEGIDRAGMVEMYHYQSMWDIRQHPAVHAAFASIFGTEKLWVSIDRVGFKPGMPSAETGEYAEKFKSIMADSPYGFIHWDICVNQRPRPFAVQGLVALCDTDERMGGFQCVPSLYRELDSWLASLPTRKAVYAHFYTDSAGAHELLPKEWHQQSSRDHRYWSIERVPLQAGDLIIWDSFLPHGNGVNFTDRDRFCQYLTMTLVGDAREALERKKGWRENLPPSGWAFPGDPRRLEEKNHEAVLSSLGRKLLGVDNWAQT